MPQVASLTTISSTPCTPPRSASPSPLAAAWLSARPSPARRATATATRKQMGKSLKTARGLGCLSRHRCSPLFSAVSPLYLRCIRSPRVDATAHSSSLATTQATETGTARRVRGRRRRSLAVAAPSSTTASPARLAETLRDETRLAETGREILPTAASRANRRTSSAAGIHHKLHRAFADCLSLRRHTPPRAVPPSSFGSAWCPVGRAQDECRHCWLWRERRRRVREGGGCVL